MDVRVNTKLAVSSMFADHFTAALIDAWDVETQMDITTIASN